jgi:hypothetical protein
MKKIVLVLSALLLASFIIAEKDVGRLANDSKAQNEFTKAATEQSKILDTQTKNEDQ